MLRRRPATVDPEANADQEAADEAPWDTKQEDAPAQNAKDLAAKPSAEDVPADSAYKTPPEGARRRQSTQTAKSTGDDEEGNDGNVNQVPGKSSTMGQNSVLNNQHLDAFVQQGRAYLATPAGLAKAKAAKAAGTEYVGSAENYMTMLIGGDKFSKELAQETATLKRLEDVAQVMQHAPTAYNSIQANVLQEIGAIKNRLDGATRDIRSLDTKSKVLAAKNAIAQSQNDIEDRITTDTLDAMSREDLAKVISSGQMPDGSKVSQTALAASIATQANIAQNLILMKPGQSITPEQNNQRAGMVAQQLTAEQLDAVANHLDATGLNSRIILGYDSIPTEGVDPQDLAALQNNIFRHNKMASFVKNTFGDLVLDALMFRSRAADIRKSRIENGISPDAGVMNGMVGQVAQAQNNAHIARIKSMEGLGIPVNKDELTNIQSQIVDNESNILYTTNTVIREKMQAKNTELKAMYDKRIEASIDILTTDKKEKEALIAFVQSGGVITSATAPVLLGSAIMNNGLNSMAVGGGVAVLDATGKIIREENHTYANPASTLAAYTKSLIDNQVQSGAYYDATGMPLSADAKARAKSRGDVNAAPKLDNYTNAIKTISIVDIEKGKGMLQQQYAMNFGIENLSLAVPQDATGAALFKSIVETNASGKASFKKDFITEKGVSWGAIKANLVAAGQGAVWDKMLNNLNTPTVQSKMIEKFTPTTPGELAAVVMFTGKGININPNTFQVNALTASQQLAGTMLKSVKAGLENVSDTSGEFKAASRNIADDKLAERWAAGVANRPDDQRLPNIYGSSARARQRLLNPNASYTGTGE